VLIIGEGGDELLAGYNRMFIPFLYNVYLKNNKNIPEKIKNNIALNLGNKFSLIEKKLHNYSNILTKNNDIEDLEVFNFLEVKEHQIPSNLKFYNNTNPNKENSFKKFLCSHLFKRDLPHILRLEDRISMSQSIENRTPFVDYKFMEYVFSIDEEFFMKDGLSKYMLRNMMSQNLPKNYFKKKKIGRPGDSKTVIFEFYYEKFCDYLLNHTNKNIYFDTDKILHNLSNDKKNKDYRFNNNIYFRILNYLIWKNQFENFNKGNTQLI
jgi:asparagine synthase (glutamine-hydrolysing)